MTYRFAAVLFFSICTKLCSALQGDSLSLDPYVSFKNKPSVFFMIDRYNSVVAGKGANTTGLKLGLDFKKKVRLGIGFSLLSSDIVERKTVITEPGHDTTLNAILSMGYITLYAEYVFYDSNNWQISMPVQTGVGSSYFTYYERVGSVIKEKKLNEQSIILFEPSGLLTYKIIKWVGVSGGIGYRQMILNNSKLDYNFNSVMYSLRLRIFIGEIFKSVFPRGLCGKRNTESAH